MENHYPSMQTRYSALVIDAVALVMLMYFFAMLFEGSTVSDEMRITAFVFTFLLFEPLCISLFGASIGHFLNGLRVKKYQEEDKNIHFVLAVFRYVLKFVLGFVSFITISSNDQSRAIHDLVSGSVVIKKQR